MDRRCFVRGSCVAGLSAIGSTLGHHPTGGSLASHTERAFPVHAIIPVVGDGKWIWTEPPEDSTGYLEPRQYDLKVGVQLRGTGTATQIRATTVAPLELVGQKIESLQVRTQGCTARIRTVNPLAGQLFLSAPSIVAGQVIAAVAHYRLVLYKDYHGYSKDHFSSSQPKLPKAFRHQYLYDSPGIQTRIRAVRDVVTEIATQIEHPWDKAKAFHRWVWENIKGKPQDYTSVVAALKDRVGDCEERAATFVAFCRAAGIPARLVWVPNHNWAEFFLTDSQGNGHWIPAHTSAYSWFGWTGAHELTLQKGDSIVVPEKRKPQRLLADWMQWQGARPKVRYLAEFTPVLSSTSIAVDAGPGARRKDDRGAWIRVGNHPLDPYCRDGEYSDQQPPDLNQTR